MVVSYSFPNVLVLFTAFFIVLCCSVGKTAFSSPLSHLTSLLTREEPIYLLHPIPPTPFHVEYSTSTALFYVLVPYYWASLKDSVLWARLLEHLKSEIGVRLEVEGDEDMYV